MLQVLFDTYGDPSEVLQCREAPLPEPEGAQVRLHVQSRCINPSDLARVRGRYGYLPALPCVPGLECVATVHACGPNAKGFREGDRVIPLQPILRGAPGTWTEYMIVDAEHLARVPREMPDDCAAQALINPFSAWCLGQELSPEPGDWVVLTAASSSVARTFRLLSSDWKIQIINVVHRADRVPVLAQEGAQNIVCTAKESLVDRVLTLTQGHGASAVVDAVGGSTLAAALQCLRPRGTVISYGMFAGPRTEMDFTPLLFRELTLKGFYMPQAIQPLSSIRRVETVEAFLELLHRKRALLPVDARYPLSRVKEAAAHADKRFRSGKVLLIND